MRGEIEQLTTVVAGLLDRNSWALSDAELTGDLVAVSSVMDRLAVAQAGLVREIDARGLYVAAGSTSIGPWLRDLLRVSIRTGRHLASFARLLDSRPGLRYAVAAGAAGVEQATVIGAALADLPRDVDDAVRDKAEALLLDHAERFEPGLLRTLGERVLDHIAPDAADATLEAKLKRDEERGRLHRHVTLTPFHDGRTRLTGWLDTEAAALVTAAIDPLSAPAPGADGPDLRTPGQRRADALTEVCRLALACGELPDSGGDRPQITVTTDIDLLTGQLGIGHLDTGGTLSAETVRRLACDAEVLPAVLGSAGGVLDLGRGKRLYVGSARRALVLRDGGCAFPACDRPPRWCQAHHIRSWIDGGPTDLSNGVLLCGHHHRLIHHSHWQVRTGADGLPEFIPPPHLDSQRRPMRNLYHRRT